jgi:hypothetical protein
MLSILKSKERNLSFVSVEDSKILLLPFADEEDNYYPEQYTKIDSLFKDIFELYTMNLYEEINPDDLEFFYECQEKIQYIIEDTTHLTYTLEVSFSGEQVFNYEDLFNKLYSDDDDISEYDSGYYSKTITYEKETTDNQWSKEEILQMD